MALWTRTRQRREATVEGPPDPYGDRLRRSANTPAVTADTALRHSAVWAALRLRANLESTLPLDAYREIGDIAVQIPKPPVLVQPGGDRVDISEWLYSSRIDLDRTGNVVGLITERNGLGLPARIDLQPAGIWSVLVKAGEIDKYRIGGTLYDPAEVWHEKQYTVAGLPVGLSPIAYAAWTIGHYLTLQQFATEWFGDNQIPTGHLRNNGLAQIEEGQATEVKGRYKAAVSGHDLFVTGKDWEFLPLQAEQAGMAWLDAMRSSPTDIARYLDVPGDLIEAAVSGSSITYANIVQRNTQLLVMHLNPALRRRELALSRLLAKPRFVRFNRKALLAMDPISQAGWFAAAITNRWMTPTEVRETQDMAPLTPEQVAEFDRLFGAPRQQPATAEAAGAAGAAEAAAGLAGYGGPGPDVLASLAAPSSNGIHPAH